MLVEDDAPDSPDGSCPTENGIHRPHRLSASSDAPKARQNPFLGQHLNQRHETVTAFLLRTQE